MSARDDILRAVRDARVATFGMERAPELPPLPAIAPRVDSSRPALVARFIDSAQAAAAQVVRAERSDLAAVVDRLHPGVTARLSLVAAVASTVAPPDDPHDLATLELFVCEGVIGVAESGAIWLPASRLGERAALVLATHVIVVLAESAIVDDLHAAYAAVDVGDEAFGVFLAGPSKTADIEQSLVIGAHGARGTTVVLVKD